MSALSTFTFAEDAVLDNPDEFVGTLDLFEEGSSILTANFAVNRRRAVGDDAEEEDDDFDDDEDFDEDDDFLEDDDDFFDDDEDDFLEDDEEFEDDDDYDA